MYRWFVTKFKRNNLRLSLFLWNKNAAMNHSALYWLPLYSVQCKVYSVQFTVYSVQFTVYTVQYTVKKAHLNGTGLKQRIIRFVRRSSTVYSRLSPIVDENLPTPQVEVEGEQVLLVAVEHVPLLPGHVTATLPCMDV